MPEDVKIVLEADASQLESEFKKAQATALQFSQKVLPATTHSLNATQVAQQRVAKGLAEGRRGVRGYSDGMLQLAQTADDAQYGLRGVMNNIPGLVMGLGGSAGLAGAASLAVLAFAKLGPEIRRALSAGEDPKALQDYLEQLDHARERTSEFAEARGKAKAQSFLRELTSEESGIASQNIALARNVDLLRLRASLGNEVAAAREALERTAIYADPHLSKEDRINKLADLDERAARRDAKSREAEIRQSFADAARKARESADADRRAREDVSKTRAELRQLEEEKRRLAEARSSGDLARASLPGAQARLAELEKGNTAGLNLTGGGQERAAQVVRAIQEARDELDRLTIEAQRGGAAAGKEGDLKGRIAALRAGLAEMEERQKGLADAARDTAASRDQEARAMESKLKSLKEVTALEAENRRIGVEALQTARKNDEMAENRANKEKTRQTALARIAAQEKAVDAKPSDKFAAFDLAQARARTRELSERFRSRPGERGVEGARGVQGARRVEGARRGLGIETRHRVSEHDGRAAAASQAAVEELRGLREEINKVGRALGVLN